MIYHFGILSTYPYGQSEEERCRRKKAQTRNAPWLGSDTLGIEITEPELAAQCGLGNIDPQHGESANPNLAAIEKAVNWPLPPNGAKLVTIRLDRDALGAMAVLLMRRDMEDLPHHAEIRARIDMIAKADKFDNGPWPGKRSIPATQEQWLEDTGANSPLAALNNMVRDAKLDELSQKVARLHDWLLCGDFEGARGYAAKAQDFFKTLAKAWEAGEIKVEPKLDGRIAVLKATHPAALSHVGYRFAPVVLAVNDEHDFGNGEKGRKFTIAQYAGDHIDLEATGREMRQFETGWGGGKNILGSPQYAPTTLELSTVLLIVKKHLCAKSSSYKSDISGGSVS